MILDMLIVGVPRFLENAEFWSPELHNHYVAQRQTSQISVCFGKSCSLVLEFCKAVHQCAKNS